MKKGNFDYNICMLSLFRILIDIYDFDTAIILLYEVNKLRGKKIWVNLV